MGLTLGANTGEGCLEVDGVARVPSAGDELAELCFEMDAWMTGGDLSTSESDKALAASGGAFSESGVAGLEDDAVGGMA